MTATPSTSKPADAGPTKALPAGPRLAVRRKQQESLTAHQITATQIYEFPSGESRIGYPDDWVIARQGIPIEVVPHALFLRLFEKVEDGLLLPPETRGALEQLLGLGATHSPNDLVKAVRRLAELEIGGILVDFTISQWAEIRHRAQKRGITAEAFLQQVIEKFTSEIWTLR